MRENIHFYFMHTHILFILSLVLQWFNTTATSLGHQGNAHYKCIVKERKALLDFKSQLQDPNDMLSTWRPEEEDDCCQWFGVGCSNRTGHVTSLDLSGYYGGLEGELSISLLNLTYLNYLSLSYNSFHGTIPEFIFSMTHLTLLRLSFNEFTGTIPESIGNMTHLTKLYLYGNQFTGSIPTSIGSLTKLTALNLFGNQFTGFIPSSIGSLTQLTYLYLDENQFTGSIPSSIGSLTQLTSLNLFGNNFSGTIPRSIGSCTKLTWLDLALSSLTVENLDWLSSLSSLQYLSMDGISLAKANNWVNAVINLPNLEELSLKECGLSQVMHPYSSSVNSSLFLDNLYLDNNNLNSSMFRWLCPLTGKKLKILTIFGNTFDGKLSDFLNSLSRCTSATTLETLDASSSQFTGSLSHEIQHFSSLINFNLSSNQLDGTISDKLWQLPNLLDLDLSFNSLRGGISEKIGKSNIWYIDLSHNSIERFLFNDDVSNLSQSILYIDFSSNKLGPRFTKWIQKLKKLTHLDLSNNSISDTVSTEYWSCWKSSRLRYLDLSFNYISAKLPKSLSNHDLDIIDLSFNSFYGRIPAFPAHISFLDLSRNKFHGGISPLCQMYKNLKFRDLSHNMITGQLPDCFQNLTDLKVVNLGHNTLSGSIPPSVGCLGKLETLSLYNNNFSGALPVSLKNCTQLSLLDLGDNKLYGDIPLWIAEKLSRLYALSLKSNNFFGTIPSHICQLVSLQILDLSDNKLYGIIPSCVNSLTSMVQKGLHLEQNIHHYLSDVISRAYGETRSNSSAENSYVDHLMIEWQGKVNEFSSILGLLKVIDLSGNNLTGQIPNEFSNLHGLLVLDLSGNSLDGKIPRDIGQMTQLLTLNLSRNMLSGEIPPTMSEMTLLNHLDVSFNDLSGRIPLGTQLQTFNASAYIGNVGLCGRPLPKNCSGDEDLGVPPAGKSDGHGESTDEVQRWFYIGGATGFATAFWIACSALLFNRRLRHAFFNFHNCLKDWVYVKVAVFIAKMQRVALA